MSPYTAKAFARPLTDGPTPPSEVQVFPAGLHTIHAKRGDKPVDLIVSIGPEAATSMQDTLAGLLKQGQRPFFDFDHLNQAASAWPTRFYWRGEGEAPGVYATVEWSSAGEAAITGRTHRSFSPTFFTTNGVPARIDGSTLNMGALVNDPAFKAIAPIWAKSADPDPISCANPGHENQPNNKHQTTSMNKEAILALLLALGVTAPADATDEQLTALLTQAKDKAAALAADAAAQAQAAQAAALTAAKATAQSAIDAAITAGRLAPKDDANIRIWRGLIEKDPTAITALNSLPATHLTQRITAPTANPAHITAKAGLIESLRAYHAAAAPSERAAIYAADIREHIKPRVALGPILAANSLGTLAGDIVVQRSFDLLRDQYPFLAAITTDFSGENANFNQTVVTRTKSPLTATDYDETDGYNDSDATTTDVSIVMDQHKAVTIAFNVNQLSSTNRDLLAEQAEGMSAALGDALMAALIAKITAENFTESSVVALNGFGRSSLTSVAKALNIAKVPRQGRVVLLSEDYYEKLGNDAAIVALATSQRASLIEEFTLPRVAGLQPYDTNLFSGTLNGFACTPAALAIATRLPNDYTGGAGSNGTVSTIQTDLGISVQKVDYVDHQKGTRKSRVALMFGTAVGNKTCGRRITAS